MSRYYEPVIWHHRGARAQSVYNDRTFAMPVRRHEPVFLAPRPSKYSSYHDYGIDDTINRADYLSNAVLEDTYEAAARSRGKDHALLRNLNAAIVSTELHVNPRVAAVSRRVRASTLPPAPRPLPGPPVQSQQYIQVAEPARPVVVLLPSNTSDRYLSDNIYASKPVVLSQAEAPWYLRARAASVPPPEPRNIRATSLSPRGYQPVYAEPLSTAGLWAHSPVPLRSNILRTIRARSVEPSSYYEGSFYRPLLPSSQLWAHRPRILRKDTGRLAQARVDNRLWKSISIPGNFDRPSDYYYMIPDVQERALSRYLYAHRGRFGPDSRPTRPSLSDFPQVYVPWRGTGPSNRSKAAVIGSRLDPDGVKKQKRPRSEFAANKLRELKREEIEEGIYYYPVPSSIGLHASGPPLPKPTDRKSIRDLDGFTKPKNLLSWQYRVESRLSPNDLIYEPASYSRMREQVKDVQGKMDRQKQLLDRYLGSDFKIPSYTSQNYNTLPAFSSSRASTSAYSLSDYNSSRTSLFTQPDYSLGRTSQFTLPKFDPEPWPRTSRPVHQQLPPPSYLPPLQLPKPKPAPLPPVKIEPPKPFSNVPSTPSTSSYGGSSVKVPAYYATGGDPNHVPMSDLRRRLRRTIAKAKNNPNYYRE